MTSHYMDNIIPLYRLYVNPQPKDDEIRVAVNEFCIFVTNALRQGSKCNTVDSITFRHDVYKVLFGN